MLDETRVGEHAVELARFRFPAQVTARRHRPATMTTTSRDLSTERISTRGSAGHSRTGPSVRPKGHPRPLMERSGRASAPPANEAGKGGAKDKLKAVIIRIVAMHTRLPSWVIERNRSRGRALRARR